MTLFTHSAVASLNNLEMMVYHYVIKNRDKVMYMTIRELADAAGVSTTTVLRFCRKLNCEGYSEFRVRYKLYLEQNEPPQANFGAGEIISFFKSVNNDEFDTLLDQAVDIIFASERIIFVGAGTSGSLAKYGARFFSNSFQALRALLSLQLFIFPGDCTRRYAIPVLSVLWQHRAVQLPGKDPASP